VTEIFYTIQGEGPWAGRPAIFVRFSKCNLRCFFCDTEFESGLAMGLDQLVNTIDRASEESKCNHIVFTGGEPFLQALGPLFRALPERLTFQIETAGTLWTEIDKRDLGRSVIVISPKTTNLHMMAAGHASAYKYIIRQGETSEKDGLPTASTQIQGKVCEIFRPERMANIYVQPMDEGDAEATHANAQEAARVAMRYGYRLSLQMHKIVGLP
jgi:7-carboxy-7-deazaguanine synthase